MLFRRLTVVVPAATLAKLPQRTLTVTFLAGTASQTDTEAGPTLAAVLAVAHVLPGLNTWVAAVGDDGYVATVTPAEALVGGRPLLISLNENGTARRAPAGRRRRRQGRPLRLGRLRPGRRPGRPRELTAPAEPHPRRPAEPD